MYECRLCNLLGIDLLILFLFSSIHFSYRQPFQGNIYQSSQTWRWRVWKILQPSCFKRSKDWYELKLLSPSYCFTFIVSIAPCLHPILCMDAVCTISFLELDLLLLSRIEIVGHFPPVVLFLYLSSNSNSNETMVILSLFELVKCFVHF